MQFNQHPALVAMRTDFNSSAPRFVEGTLPPDGSSASHSFVRTDEAPSALTSSNATARRGLEDDSVSVRVLFR
jgi:hypothetical protein